MSVILHFITGVSLGFEIVDGEQLGDDEVAFAVVVDLVILRIIFEKSR